MKYLVVFGLLVGGCATIEPGHRGLYFDKLHHSLRHDVYGPGLWRLGALDRMDDFDVTYSTRKEEIQAISADRLAIDMKVAIIFRPIVSELYDLDVEIGPNYYDEVVGREFRSAVRGVIASHSYLELQQNNKKIEDEVEAEVRGRITGKHIEINSVTFDDIAYAPQIISEDRDKLVGERQALRRQAALEADALRQRLELEQQAEREKMQAEAAMRRKNAERVLAEEQARIDKVKAETEAATALTKAKAQAEELTMLAKAHAEEKKAEAQHLTPLMVQMHAYDALAKLGGEGAHLMLGDWSHVPSFLFPGFGNFGARGVATNR